MFKKFGFTSKELFLNMGYKFEHVISADLSGYEMPAVIADPQAFHSYGTLVRDPESGTVFLLNPKSYLGIGSMNVFRSHKFDLKKVLTWSAADRLAMGSGQLILRDNQPFA